VVLLLRGEPPAWAQESEAGHTPHAQFANKVYNVKERGGKAVLIVNQRPEAGQQDGLIMWDRPAGGDPDADYGLPAFHITRAFAESLLSAGGAPALSTLQSKLDSGDSASILLSGVNVRGRAGLERAKATTRNVVGIVSGSGPFAGEVLIIGAHYDHLGVVIPRQTFAERQEQGPQIHNGADDNASGTAGVIELARAFSGRDDLQRSIMFVAFSAEEAGLLGSKHFVEESPVPLDRIVGVLNMDMIGRLPKDSNKIQVFGTKSAAEFEPMLQRELARHDFELKATGGGFGASDHTAFYLKGIPGLHFFTGLHKDYHLPSDDPGKINAEGATALLACIRDIALEIAQAESPPTFQKVTTGGDTTRTHYRVRIGIMPSFADEGEGLGVDGVSEGGPAQAAGIQAGDVIIQEGGTQVRNIYDHMAALRKYKPGDEIEVTVLRDGQKLTFKVKLAGS
jgi:hypothetical protein